MSYNKVILLGNLTRDPEMRVTQKGTAICQFSIAVNRTYKDQEEVSYIEIEAWNKQAEAISKYMARGKPIMIEGRLKQESWDDKKTGEKRYKLKVVLESFQFVGSKSDDEGGPGNDSQPSRGGRQSVDRQLEQSRRQATPTQDDIDEDVPF